MPSVTWSAGLGAFFSASPYRDYTNKAMPVPMLRYDGKSFYIHGASVGYRFYNTHEDEFALVASPLWQRFLHQDTHDPRLRLLSDRDISGSAGLAWRHHAEWGTLQASAQKEFTGHGGGSLFDVSYGYPLAQGNLQITPEVGAVYTSRALNDYYYGISLAEAANSGLPSYRPGGSTSPYLGVVASYQVSGSWLANAGLRYSVLPKAVKDSPMVDSSHTQTYFFALSYLF
ncbi:MipA/OmpV family protein [Dyella flagellata]|uniref:Membrane protein n=1 Tax=Dyella flagellata TaxID=1867833 RepID=A0ABQ5XAC6_9GAMM|nr:membrane protein [Dyella flagellata]